MKIAVWAIGISMVIMTISGVILAVRKGFSALSVTGIAFFPLVIIFSSQLKKLNEELEKKRRLSFF
mgnify:CR=1 FL=1